MSPSPCARRATRRSSPPASSSRKVSPIRATSTDSPSATRRSTPARTTPSRSTSGEPSTRRSIRERRTAATASCGICGTASIEDIARRCPPLPDGPRVDPGVLRTLPTTLRAAQATFNSTGGLHASGLFDPDGRLLRAREDVGRHNALDKLIGASVLARELPLHGTLLLVSGRVSFELVQKAAMAGIPLLVAVGAPTDLAVDTATRMGMTLSRLPAGRAMQRLYATGPPGSRDVTAPADPKRPKRARRLAPDMWVSLRPNGIGLQKPNHYADMAQGRGRTARAPATHRGSCAGRVRRVRPRAWPGCTTGPSTASTCAPPGSSCWSSTRAARSTRRASRTSRRCASSRAPSCASSAGSPIPMRRRRGEPGFRRIAWDEALRLAAGRIRGAREADARTAAIARLLPDEPRHHERGLLRRPARRPGPWASPASTRPRGCATRRRPSGSRRSIGVAAHHLLAPGRHRERPRRAVGRDTAEQPAGVHEVPLPGQASAARRVVVVNPYLEPGLERYWVPSNAESRALRHEDVRPPRAGAARRRRRASPTPRSSSSIERARSTDAFVDAHTDGLGRAGGRARRARSLDDLLDAGRPHRDQLEAFVDLYAAADARRAPVVDGHHPAPRRGRRRAGHREPRRWRGATSAATAPGSCRIRGHSGVQGGAEMGAYATRVPRRRRRRRAERATRSPTQWGFPVPDRARAHRARDGRGRRARASSTCCGLSGGNFLEVLPDPTARRGRARRGCRCGSTRTSCSPRRCWWTGDDVILLPVATRYEQEGGGTETTTERRIVFSPEIPRPGRRGPQRVAPLRRPGARGSHPARVATVSTGRKRRPSVRRSPSRARLRRHRATLARTGDACSGAAGTCAPAAFPDRRRPGPLPRRSRRRSRRCPPGGSCRHPPGQAVQLDGVPASATR